MHHSPKPNKAGILRKILVSVLPALIVAGVIFSANTYFDLDVGKVIIQEITRIVGQLETTATTTLATLGGNVGIGTTNPGTMLHLYNTSTPPTIRLQDTATQYGSIWHQSGILWLKGGNSVGIVPASATDKGLIIRGNASQTGNLFEWQNSAGTALGIINKDGWLGIGTSPSSKLQVSSGASYFGNLPAPSGVSATATSGGTLAEGTYYYIVFALDANNLPSPASAEVSATVDGSNTNAVTISWSAVAGAAKYRVFGRSQGAENQFWETTSTSFTDTGTSGTSDTPPQYGTSAYFARGVGIGNTGGIYKLYVYDSSPQNVDSYSSYFYVSNPNTSGSWYGTGFTQYAAPTADSSATYEGARIAATSASSSSYNISTLTGVEAYGLYYGTGVATNVRGGYFIAYNYSTGTTTYAEAIKAQVVNNSTGTITNAYGVRIPAFTNNGTITNRWGIYQEGTSENNYFAGKVGLGTATPASKLTVQGDLYISATSTFMGNVGIGNTNPASLLTVGSGGQFQVDSSGDIVKIKNISYSWPSSQAAGANYVLANNGAGTLSWSSLSSLGVVLGTGTTNYLAKWTDSTTLATSTIYDSGTYVAIGTTTSPAKLTVYDSGGNQLRLSYSDAYYADFKVIGGGDLQISPTSGILALRTSGVQSRFQVYSTSTNYLEITHTGTKGVLSVTAGDIEIGTPGSPVYIEEITSISASSASSTLSVTQSGSGYALEVIGTAHLRGGAGKTGLYVDSNGKVGIGTTYPTARLHISTGDLSTTPFQVDISSSGSSPLPGWPYRKPITISTSSQALTNYQVSVTLDTASLISNNKMRSDCADIRFTDSDGSTLLNYWLESGCNSASTKIWIKVPSIPTSTTKTIYVYYGNPSATSQSNGTSTFEFFDDFDDGVFDTNRWGVQGSAGSNESGGILNTQGSGEGLVYSKWYPTSTGSYIFRFKIGGTGYSSASYTIGQQGGETTNTILDVFYGTAGTYYYSGGWTGSRSRTSRSVTTGDIVDVQYTVGTSTWYFYLNGSLLDTLTQAVNCPSAGIGFRTYSTTEYIKVDYTFVRKYNSPDPTASVGTEETVASLQTVFYIQNQTGNVGIGTTSPAYKLTVNGNLYVSATSTLGSATSTPVIFGGYVQSNIIPFADNQYTLGLSNYRWANVYAATGTFGGTITIGTNTIQGNATTTLFTSGNANQLVLGATGNVGIGTTTPAAKLTVQGDLYISATSTFMGNVGIGTASPASLLTVGSGGQFQVDSSGDIVKIKNISYSWPSSQAAGANYVLANDGSGNLSWLSVPGLGGVTGTGSPGQAAFWTGTSSISGDNNFWWDSTNKRLGIGTNQPTEILHLSKSGTLAIRYQSSSLNPTNTQPYNPSSVVSDSSNGGTVSWASPLNATTSDNQYATSAGASAALSHYLKATNFGFNIPATNTIVGIVVEIERKSGTPSGNGVVDNTVKLVKGGVVVGDNKADTATAWPTSDTYKSYGGSNDLWGTTWTPSDINTSTFGVVLSVNFNNPTLLTAYVDHIRVTVYYAESAETNWLAGIDSQDSGKFKLSASSSLTSNTVLTLTPSGYVGIGTTSPASTLQVYGNSTFVGGNVGIGTTNPTAKLTITATSQTENGLYLSIATTSSSYYALNILSGGNSRFYVGGDGKVGIGTNQPTEILHLSKSGTLAIRYQSSSLNPTNTQPYNPSSVVSDSSNGGTVSWASPLNATTSDNQYATSAGASAALSHYLKATNFGFNIPATNTIVGIVVEIERKSDIPPSGTGVVDNTVKLVKGGVVVGDNKADTANAWPTTDTYKSYGGSNDLWGTTWTPSDINTSTFGVVLSVNFYASGPLTAYVDHIRVTVYYAESAETNWLAGVDSQDSGKFKLSASSSLTSNTVLTLTPSGYVGIGTTTPSRLLTIDAKSTSTVALGVMGSANFTGVVNQNSGGVDIAEAFPIDQNCYKENKCPEVGEVVSISENRTIEKATLPYDSKLLGVVSGNAGIIMWGGFDATSSRLVALAGRVPVKVSTENGPIFAGDPLTAASSTPGVAMKATRAGRVIGIALEDYQGKEIKEVMMLVNPHWLGNDLTVQENENKELVNTYTEQLRVGLSSLGLVVNVNGELEVQKLTTEKLCLKENGEAICITKEQFRELLEKNQINPEVVKENSSTESSSTEAVTSTTSESSSTTSENSSTTSENSTTVASSTE